MTREIRLNAFTMNTVGHLAPGQWRNPRDRSQRYTDVEHWAELAQILERGRFDALFIADVIGLYDVYGGSRDAALRHAVQVPIADPTQLVSAMALVTKHLGFGITSSVTYEHPYPFARRFSTLDHLTKGRIGWNVVTSYLDSGARGIGLPRLADHGDRYDLAEEYLEVCYKLWEASWEDGAVRRDAATGAFADPARIHAVQHRGAHFTVDAAHLCEPSPQRTPVIYQAGASSRGRRFAARHAEAVFVGAPSKTILRNHVRSLRESAEAAGRRPEGLVILNMHTVIVGETEAAARAKHEEALRFADRTGALALLSGWTGLDLGRYRPEDPLRYVRTNAGQSAVEAFSSADPAREWTIAEMAEWAAIGGRGPVTVGSPQQVADELQEWVEATGVDGFNLASVVMPETFRDVAELLVPELQRRGVFKRDYAPGTLREKLFGAGPRLPAQHPAAAVRPQDAARAPAPALG